MRRSVGDHALNRYVLFGCHRELRMRRVWDGLIAGASCARWVEIGISRPLGVRGSVLL